ncbi:MAG: endolytic transglycosylase MltG [Clostridia bacterium]|jgi:UPF0755 protein|nr:endolytic transglycosylase MltG [Clostridia bacterium]
MRSAFKYIIILILAVLIVVIFAVIFSNKRFFGDNSIMSRLLNKPAPEPVLILRPEKSVTLLEGWTNKDMAQYFERQGIWQAEEFLELAGFPKVNYDQETELSKPLDYSSKFDFLKDKPKNTGLEGYLFPDTYRIFADEAKPEDLIEKMLNNFDHQLTAEMRAEIKKQGRTIYEVVIMASLVEKEAPINYKTGDNKDAKIIAGIFWDRIKNGQALQSCASLAYILEVNKPQYSTEDTKIDSLYNTYKYLNLPPGPVSNPGILALEATIYPIYTEYNFFLTPAKSKDVVYSVSYQEHLRNKLKYLP